MFNKAKRVAIIAGARTPFIKAGTEFKDYSALDLGTKVVRGLLQQSDIDKKIIDEMVFGVVIHNPKIPQLAREIGLASEMPATMPAYTVSNNCITGIQAATCIYDSIVNGRADVGIAGGVESMSIPPLLVNKSLSEILIAAQKSKSILDKLRQLTKIRFGYIKPEMFAIAEPSTGLTMGEHCELMAKEWHITREEQDKIAYNSHINAAKATSDGCLSHEIIEVDGISGDNLIRSDTSPERLAKLKPVFDKSSEGTITAGNSSPLTDGAAAVLLMSENKAKSLGLEPLAYIKAFTYAAIEPKDGLLMAPAIAVPKVLKAANVELNDMDLIEMHEAFAAQVACNIKALESGWRGTPLSPFPWEKLNTMGGSIALGHPFAATGGRIMTTLANAMQRDNLRYGLISICAAGAMAAAMILERDV